MPDQPGDLPNPNRLYREYAVIYAEALLEVDGVLGDLILDEKYQLFLFEQGPDIEHLQVSAKLSPIGIMQIDVVLPAHPLAFAHVII